MTVTSASITASRTKTGYQYSDVVTVRESGGVGVAISAIDLTFSANGTPLGTTHFDNPFGSKTLGEQFRRFKDACHH